MLLQELSRISGVSVASIKYYRREGLLPPGERLTATRFDYGPRHRDRLDLIQVLREAAGSSIAEIRALCAALDDPDRPIIAALEIAQALALRVPAESLRDQVPQDEDPRIAPLLAELGWPDVPTVPRTALDALLREMRSMEIPVSPESLLRYARPMARIAAEDLEDIRRPDGAPQEQPPSPDVIVMRAVVGSLAFARLLVVLRALGHASLTLSDAGLSRTHDGSAPPRDG